MNFFFCEVASSFGVENLEKSLAEFEGFQVPNLRSQMPVKLRRIWWLRTCPAWRPASSSAPSCRYGLERLRRMKSDRFRFFRRRLYRMEPVERTAVRTAGRLKKRSKSDKRSASSISRADGVRAQCAPCALDIPPHKLP